MKAIRFVFNKFSVRIPVDAFIQAMHSDGVFKLLVTDKEAMDFSFYDASTTVEVRDEAKFGCVSINIPGEYPSMHRLNN